MRRGREMFVVEFFKGILNGRGVFPSFLVISSWSFTLLLLVLILYNFLLYMFRVRYRNKRFTNGLVKKNKK